MIRRIGRYEVAVGVTSRYSAARDQTVFGIQYTRLSGGHTIHVLLGRFGVYVGGWGPV